MIKPTIGRKVWFRPNGLKESAPGKPLNIFFADQPLDATVVCVWGDRVVNLLVVDHGGAVHSICSVTLLQGDEPTDPLAHYCEWMPYQQGQAKKAETPQTEVKTYADGTVATGLAPLPASSPVDARMSFGAALEALKQDATVARQGWNGKGMWLALVEPHCYDVGCSVVGHGTKKLLPWIGMKTSDNGFVPWLASQTDLLAEDWVLMSNPKE